MKELRELYDVVILCYGSDIDTPLNIEGENIKNVISAREFVGWYNGLPQLENLNPDLSGEVALLIGQGNVAIDVARYLKADYIHNHLISSVLFLFSEYCYRQLMN